MFIIFNALIFSHVLTELRIPQDLANLVISEDMRPWMFLIIVNVILLIGGQFMEPSGLLLIVALIVYPIAMNLGIDPIHLGIIMVVNMEIGMITPPVGLNLFVTSSITKMGILRVMQVSLPWVGILFIFLMIVTYVPQVGLFLPNLAYGTPDPNVCWCCVESSAWLALLVCLCAIAYEAGAGPLSQGAAILGIVCAWAIVLLKLSQIKAFALISGLVFGGLGLWCCWRFAPTGEQLPALFQSHGRYIKIHSVVRFCCMVEGASLEQP